jgi:hypothetical protein
MMAKIEELQRGRQAVVFYTCLTHLPGLKRRLRRRGSFLPRLAVMEGDNANRRPTTAASPPSWST